MHDVLSMLWHFLKGWSGLVFGILATLFYGPKKLIETWDWYLDRFYDSAVFAIVKKPVFRPVLRSSNIPSPGKVEHVLSPHQAGEISKQLKRKEKRVTSSLRRLESRGKIKGDGWGGWYPKL
jgi:hypothetical protein